MLFAVLLLGLLPIAFLPDGSEASSDEKSEDQILDLPTDDSGDCLEDMISETSDSFDSTITDENDDILDPVNEDDVADSGGQVPEPDEILPPDIEDDYPALPDGEVGKILDPVDEDDTPGVNNIVSAPQSFANDTLEVVDFDSSDDVLCIYVSNPSEVSEDNIEVKPSKNGEDSKVYVNGKLVAILKNTSTATVSNIYLTQLPDAA